MISQKKILFSLALTTLLSSFVNASNSELDTASKLRPTNTSTNNSIIMPNKELEDKELILLLKATPDVEILNLVNNDITDIGLEAISNCGKINFLNISGNNNISYKGVMKMLSEINKTPIIQSLKTLNLTQASFDENQKRRLITQGDKTNLKINFH